MKSFNPHQLAADGLVHYCGDVDPLNHDGYWYDSSTWLHDGYASCIEVLVLLDGPANARHILVSKLVVNKPKDMTKALESCGTPQSYHDNVNAQIEACKGYMGAEPDESDWREPSTYAFILPDEGAECRDFADYAKIHNAAIASETDVYNLLAVLVGRDLCQKLPAYLVEEDEGHEAEAQADRDSYNNHGDSDES